MDLVQLFSFSPLIIAGFYLLLVVIAFIRRNETNAVVLWLIGYLTVSSLWQLSTYLFASPIGIMDIIPALLNLIASLALLMSTGAYIDKPYRFYQFLLGLSTIFLTAALHLAVPFYIPLNFGIIRLPQNGVTLLLILYWIVLMVTAYGRTIKSYRNNPFPWHANRHLFWANSLMLAIFAEFIYWIDSPIAWIIGNAVRLIAVIALVYASSTYIRFDVRSRFRRIIILLIITIASALPAVGAFYLFSYSESFMTPTAAVVVVIAGFTVLFALYQPYRRFIDNFVYRYLIGARFQTKNLIRNYTQAISKTVDIDQLALVIFRQYNELFEVRRGALMLVTPTDKGYTIEPIPAVGDLSRDVERVTHHSPFITKLSQSQQPLLQYEIDFDSNNAPIREEMNEWFTKLRMELYVPIKAEDQLKGFIAIGPKASGLTYRPNELEALQLLADQTFVALQNALLYSELGQQNEKVRHLNEDLLQQNERLGTMDKVKSDFITIASHELRTPLTQIKGYSDILAAMNEENALTREQTREIVNHIERASTRLEGLISAMLDASQIDVDEMHLTFVNTQIDTIWRMAGEPLTRSMINRGLRYEFVNEENLPNIQADFKRLAQAFRNILGNAVKYTPDGGLITVYIKHIFDEDQIGYLEISVVDTGIGIDKQNHELIFEKFFRVGDPQLHSTGTTKFMGAGPGLGLPIAKGVIEGHGGRIWVESSGEDKERFPGTTVYIMLPVEPQAHGVKTDELLGDMAFAIGNNGRLTETTADGETEERPPWLIG